MDIFFYFLIKEKFCYSSNFIDEFFEELLRGVDFLIFDDVN